MLENLSATATTMSQQSNLRMPDMKRDSTWLAGADLFSVFLALVGQVILTRSLFSSDYGLFIILLDLFATTFLIVDLGLPTLLARDGVKAPHLVWPAVWRVYGMQLKIGIPFFVLTLLLTPQLITSWQNEYTLLVLTSVVAIVHIASYAPRSALRAIGEARIEGITKVIERAITTILYCILFLKGYGDVEYFAAALLAGASISWLFSLIQLSKLSKPLWLSEQIWNWKDLGDSWVSPKQLFFAAMPFAITLGILPYVIRIEKFILAGHMGVDAAALFHVAQLAWLAGLVVPQAMRSALLPVLGNVRNDESAFNLELKKSIRFCFNLMPIGFYCGVIIVWLLLPMAFPLQYTDGSLGASAVDIFFILLFGWSMTLLATPFYTALKAGKQPWKFTLFILLVVLFGSITGWILISYFSEIDVRQAIASAAFASSLTSLFLLVLSIHLSNSWPLIKENIITWIVLISSVAIASYSLWNREVILAASLPAIFFIFSLIYSKVNPKTLEHL
jgi:O-antigen/teichoic acid export membrane protein